MGRKKHIKLINTEINGETTTSKECTTCFSIKSLESFHKDRNGLGGRASKCKDCKASFVKKYNKTDMVKSFVFERDGELFKRCKDCQEDKSVKEFYPHGNNSYVSQCKVCYTSSRRKGTAPKKIEIVNVGGVDSKECRMCNETKPLEEFPKGGERAIGGVRGNCSECQRKIWRKYRLENREKYVEMSRMWRENNPDKQKESSKRWRQANRDKDIVYRNRRQSKKEGLRDELTTDEWEEILQYFNYSCALTGIDVDVSMDHFIPVSVGYGGTFKGNVYPLQSKINGSKWNRNPFEWYQEYGDRHGVTKRRWEGLIAYLSSINGMSPEEFETYVNDVFTEEGQADAR